MRACNYKSERFCKGHAGFQGVKRRAILQSNHRFKGVEHAGYLQSSVSGLYGLPRTAALCFCLLALAAHPARNTVCCSFLQATSPTKEGVAVNPLPLLPMSATPKNRLWKGRKQYILIKVYIIKTLRCFRTVQATVMNLLVSTLAFC